MQNHKPIDVHGLSKRNPKVDTNKLHKSFQLMQDLKMCGVTFGANYNLGSPYSAPRPHRAKGSQRAKTVIRLSEKE